MCRAEKGGQKSGNTSVEKRGKKMKSKFKKRIDKVEAEIKPSDSDTTDSEKVSLHVVTIAKTIRQDNAASSAIWVRPKVEGQTTEMELDTGAAVLIISERLYNAKFSQVRLHTTNILLKSYTGQVMTPLGVLKVNVRLNKHVCPCTWSRETLLLFLVESG